VFSSNSKQLKIQLCSSRVAYNHKRSGKHAIPVMGARQKAEFAKG
jgi:hypothetical protein